MESKKENYKAALKLFMETDLSQKEISAKAGVSEKTIGTWAKEDGWHEKKANSIRHTSDMIESMQKWSHDLKNKITTANRLPSYVEAETLYTLAKAIRLVQGNENSDSAIRIFDQFKSFVEKKGEPLPEKLIQNWILFLESN